MATLHSPVGSKPQAPAEVEQRERALAPHAPLDARARAAERGAQAAGVVPQR